MAYAIGEIFFSPVAGFMTERYPYIFTMFTANALDLVGGILYGTAVETWMVIVAWFFIGSASGVAASATLTYIGEMSTRMDNIRERKGEKPRKHVAYIVYHFIMNGSFLVSFGELLIIVGVLALLQARSFTS